MFYDLGNGPTGQVVAGVPFEASKLIFGGSFPLTASDASPPPITTNPPFSSPIVAFPHTLKLPYTYQWNLAFQQSLGTAQTVSVSYLGAAGHGLIRDDAYLAGVLPPGFNEVDFVNNGGYSHYNALQTQFRRRLTRGLDVIGSYTFSHSLDNVSDDGNRGIPTRFLNPRLDYSSSDFDIRHSSSVAIDYAVPTSGNAKWKNALLGGWSFGPMLTVRSSPVVDVVIQRDIGFGNYSFRPDLVPGVPLYMNQASPGGRQINPAALSVPTVARQGDLGRNFFRGFPLVQVDVGARRRFRLTEKMSLQARLEAFNVLNHPNFAPEASFLGTVDPSGNLTIQNGFGVSASMLGQGLQSGSFGSGFSPLYQIGGSRSLQIALKLEF